MREVTGDMWAYEGRKGFKICITTNGFIKKNGEGVTGAGNAQQATERYPDFPRLLGLSLQKRGNVLSLITSQLLSFPVKYNWFEDADIDLIEESTKALASRAKANSQLKYILPRPGCENGHLSWKIVRPVLLKHLRDLDNVFVIDKENENGDSRTSKGKSRYRKKARETV